MGTTRARRAALVWACLALSITSDLWSNDDWPLLTNLEPSSRQSDSLDSQYFKVGCLLIRYRDDYLLTDPLFSSPPLWRAWFSVKSSVDEEFPGSADIDWTGIRGILVGHGHYDHVLDAPYVLERTGAVPRVYGSQTVVNMLDGAISSDQLVAVADDEELLETGWKTVPDSPFRFRAFLSDHTPLIFRYRIARGTVDNPLDRLPRNIWQWKSGRTLTYLIDVMPIDSDTIRPKYRIFFQSSASSAPMGIPEKEILRDKDVDLAIISAASFERAPGYPEKLLRRLKPKQVMIVHHERFWKPMEAGKTTVLPFLDIDTFLERLYTRVDPAGVHLPVPASILTID